MSSVFLLRTWPLLCFLCVKKYVAKYMDIVSLVLLMKGMLSPFYCFCPITTELFKLRSGEGEERAGDRRMGDERSPKTLMSNVLIAFDFHL